VSVSFAAVQLARKIFGKLDGRRVLVIGAGEMGQLTARHLRTNGVGDIVVTGRTLARAEEVAATVGGTAVSWSEMKTALGRADIVVTATGSPTPLITRDDVAAVMGRQRREPLFVIDIAVPRDVEADAGDIEQVFLYNIDDLQAIVHENMSRRSSEVQRAEDIVAEEVGRFMAWRRSRGAVSTVVALRRRFDAIRRSELQRLDFKLTGLKPTERARVEEVTRLIVEKLLIEPTEQLKALPDEETQVAYTDAVRRLFALRDDREAEAEDGRRETEGRKPGSSDTSSS
jgi:glutamyl-tRNA reductase